MTERHIVDVLLGDPPVKLDWSLVHTDPRTYVFDTPAGFMVTNRGWPSRHTFRPTLEAALAARPVLDTPPQGTVKFP